MSKKLKDGDYVLTEGAAWIEVKGLAIRIFHDGQGVMISVCPNGQEYDTLNEIYVDEPESADV